MELTLKDLIRINQETGESGELQNRSSLEYALNAAKYKKNWLYSLSYIVRSLLVDHAFQEGNKRTAAVIIHLSFDEKGLKADKDDLNKLITSIASKNIKGIRKIAEMIHDVKD